MRTQPPEPARSASAAGASCRAAQVYPAWIRLACAVFVAVLVPVYWHHYGPANFLWFSDIALFSVLLTLWTGWHLPYSMMAVGVLPLETLWLVDFLAAGNTTGMAAYMFDGASPLYLRALSLFHLALPPLLIWMLVRQGYDRRALGAQTVLAWIVLPLTALVSEPGDNINWVFGPGFVQDTVPHWLYLAAYMLLAPLVVFLPMHLLLGKLFGPPKD